MGDVVSGHSQYGHLSDRAFTTMQSSCSLVNRRKIGTHIAWISSASRNFLSGCRNFSESFRVIRHVGENDENMGAYLDCEILGSGQCESWSQDSFDRWIVGEVDEHGYVVESALFLEIVSEEAGFVGRDAHSCEDGGERFVCASDLGLPGDLGGDLVVGEP